MQPLSDKCAGLEIWRSVPGRSDQLCKLELFSVDPSSTLAATLVITNSSAS